MPYLNDYVLDAALAKLDTEATRLDICSAEPTTYSQATTSGNLSLGNKTGITVGAPADRTPNGRRVTIAAITDGSVSANGTATHWALTDPANSRLLAAGALSASQVVSSGNTFTLAAFDVGIPDAV